MSGCATGSKIIPSKYELDNQLEQVPNISKYSIMGWEKVDRQSFILQATPGDFYLFVLLRPSYDLMFGESIAISSTGSMIWPGYNNIVVLSDPFSVPYVIERIYRLEGREQARDIALQLSGEK
jgi:hypothetical protein